ncbi:MAG: GWxTD domain-containing protein [Phaeodactylibacter sp.]|uniref:GWxTD domain-containing protein n=1 Tax=Phaeodactylibacter sp. TaxID=1940289 RepID=UPI0032EFFAA3
MKKSILTIVASICFSIGLFAIDASISFATFKTPDNPYIEVYLHIAGQTVAFKEMPDSLYQANVEVVILFKQGDEIIKFDKYALNSPLTKNRIDFIDLKRFALDPGQYDLVVAVSDLNEEGNAKEYNTDFNIGFSETDICQSGLTLLSSYDKAEAGEQSMFVKNGIKMEPLPFNFYNRRASRLIFYNEVYNSEKVLGEDYLVSYSIEPANKENAKPIMIGHKRQKPAPVVPVLIGMDITELPSGNYTLIVEVRDRAKGLLSRKTVFFQRSNPFLEEAPVEMVDFDVREEFVQMLDEEELEYSLRALTPKIPQNDVEAVDIMIKKENIEGQRLYLFSYWAGQAPNNPQAAYDKYMEIARAVDQMYDSGFRHGFETDRGYYYLKYGQPDDMEMRDQEPSAPPYEIWTYYEFPATNQNNVKFVFYNPSLSPGDYTLLHSTAIGERSNPSWLRELYRNAPANELNGDDPFGGNDVMDNFNRNASRVFRDY